MNELFNITKLFNANSYLIIVDAFAMSASMLSFILALLHLWKGLPYEKVSRRTQVKLFLFLALFLGGLTSYWGLKYRSNLQATLEQTGDVQWIGIHEIYYPIPYCSKPYLEVEEIEFCGGIRMSVSHPGEPVFKILEQTKDGFKVELSKVPTEWDDQGCLDYQGRPIGLSPGLEWKAIGKVDKN